MSKKENVHLQLSEELSDIDAELEQAMEDLSGTNQRINDFLNEEDGSKTPDSPQEVLASEATSGDDEQVKGEAEAQSNE